MNLPLRIAASTPAMIPMSSSITKATIASRTVIGIFCAMMSVTGRPRKSVPKSPVNTPVMYFTYWTKNGSSRLYCARIASMLACDGERSPNSARMGSPGSRNTSA